VRLRATHHALAPPVRDDRLRGFGASYERTGNHFPIELRAIGRELRLKVIKKSSLGRPPGFAAVFTISGGTAQSKAVFRHAALAVPRQIMYHLAAAGGMPDVNGIFQIKVRS